MTTTHKTRAARPGRHSRWGFTLVELLMVMFILSVLVGLVVGVSWYVIETGRRKETIITQKKLLAAIDAYRKVTGRVPDDLTDKVYYDPDSSISYKYNPQEVMGRLLNVLTTGTYDNTYPDVNSAIYKATHPFLGESSVNLTTDAYGNSMVYLKDGGMGGTPAIVSAGPDGKFGFEKGQTDAQRQQYRKDNIRSDMN